jgi:hypothetical protein
LPRHRAHRCNRELIYVDGRQLLGVPDLDRDGNGDAKRDSQPLVEDDPYATDPHRHGFVSLPDWQAGALTTTRASPWD